MELTPEAKDALVGLFAVKLDLCTERSVEKAIAKNTTPGGLLKELTALGAVNMSDHPALLEGLDPEIVPGYRIEGEAGRGGMGVVYRARQTSMDRLVALKLLSRRLSSDESYVEKFLAEARSAAKLNHENVVGAINAGEANGLYYFVMEFVDGESAAEHLERDGPYDPDEAFRIAEAVARGLEHAHEVGIVHRDVKPENIVITANAEVRLCDLGLAKPLAVAGTGEKSDMTEGTPYYCSPEQALGRTDIDARSDVYSLALTLYHMITGEPAYEGDGPREILVQQVRAPAPDLDLAMPEVAPPLRTLLAKMMVKEREQRLGSMRDFLRLLDAARRGPQAPSPSQRLKAQSGGVPAFALVAAVLLGLLGTVLVGWALFAGDPAADTDDRPHKDDDDGEDDSTDVDDTDADDGSGNGRRGRSGRRRPPVDPVDDPPPSGTSPADQALERARNYMLEHPDDPRGAYERLLAVKSSYPDEPAAGDAQRAADALFAQLEAEGNAAFERVGEQTKRLVVEHRYKSALAGLDAFHAEWRDVLPEIPALKILRRTVLDAATSRLRELAGAEDEAGLEALAAEVPDELSDALEGARGELAQRTKLAEAARAFETARAEFWSALLSGDTAKAEQIMRPFAARGAFKAQAVAHVKEAAGVAQARKAFEGACADLQQVSFSLDTGGEVEGRVSTFVPAELRFALNDSSGNPVQLRAAALAGAELVTLLPATSDTSLRGRALFFLSMRAPQGARAALAEAEASGAPMPTDQRTSFEGHIRNLEEQVVDERIASLGALKPQAVVQLATGGFSPDLRKTATYKRGFEQIKQAFLRARGEQLAADPAGLLAGDYKDKRTGMTLEYDFEVKEQLDDFVAGGFPASKSTWKGKGHVQLRGRVALRPRFAPGTTLKIQAKLRAQDGQRPNLNLLLSPGGWSGCLVGLGYRAGSARDVTIDPGASRKGGFTMSLPCNVVGTLKGSPPDGLTCLAADYSPSVLGNTSKVHRVQIDRTRRNELRVKVGGRSLFRVDDVGGDQPCQLVFAPFNQELILTELEVTGEFDPAWLRERGEELAGAEVGNLPPPL